MRDYVVLQIVLPGQVNVTVYSPPLAGTQLVYLKRLKFCNDVHLIGVSLPCQAMDDKKKHAVDFLVAAMVCLHTVNFLRFTVEYDTQIYDFAFSLV